MADGKERLIQSMSVTTFWGEDGKPVSAAQFLERLYGELPALFKDEDELRAIWSNPDTRSLLLHHLADKDFGLAQLDEMKKLIDAEESDIFDVLAYVAFPSNLVIEQCAYQRQRPRLHRATIINNRLF